MRASARIYPKILLLSAEIQMSSVFVIRQGGNYSGLCLSCFVLKNNGVKPGERKKQKIPGVVKIQDNRLLSSWAIRKSTVQRPWHDPAAASPCPAEPGCGKGARFVHCLMEKGFAGWRLRRQEFLEQKRPARPASGITTLQCSRQCCVSAMSLRGSCRNGRAVNAANTCSQQCVVLEQFTNEMSYCSCKDFLENPCHEMRERLCLFRKRALSC